MKARYQKPVASNLGEVIPDVIGDCRSGARAGQFCRNGATNDQPNCNFGNIANGACDNGSSALPSCAKGTGPNVPIP